MQPLIDLVRGLDIINPFLTQYGFEFQGYDNGQGSGGQFTMATYINAHKKFIINYRFLIGHVIYQYDHSKIGHDFYLDQLGLADKKKLPDFHTQDKLLAFQYLLNDFEYLKEDFFDGECLKLIAFSKLQENVVSGYGGKTRMEYDQQLDKDRIEEARQKFRSKDFKGSVGIYRSVEIRSLLNELDSRLIEYAEKHVKN